MHATMAARGIDTAQLQAQLQPLLAGVAVARIFKGNLPLDIYVRLAHATRSFARRNCAPCRSATMAGPRWASWPMCA